MTTPQAKIEDTRPTATARTRSVWRLNFLFKLLSQPVTNSEEGWKQLLLKKEKNETAAYACHSKKNERDKKEKTGEMAE